MADFFIREIRATCSGPIVIVRFGSCGSISDSAKLGILELYLTLCRRYCRSSELCVHPEKRGPFYFYLYFPYTLFDFSSMLTGSQVDGLHIHRLEESFYPSRGVSSTDSTGHECFRRLILLFSGKNGSKLCR